jgi:hypothetical protein
MKSQTIQDLFPESAMNFKICPKLDILAFDPNPMTTSEPMVRMKGGPMPSVTTHQTSMILATIKQRGGVGGTSSIGVGYSQFSPQSITAEIEQLDVIANLASSSTSFSTVASSTSAITSGNSVPSRTALRSSIRKVRQSASYAEPSTKSKLRRGDVLFQKVDPVPDNS